MRARVLVTTAWLRPGDAVDRLLHDAGIDVVHSSFRDRATTGDSLTALAADADAIIAGTDEFSPALIAGAPRLKVIGRTGVGVDNIAVDAATARGIAVCPTPGANSRAVAEHTIGLLLSAARLIPQNVAAVRSGHWDQPSGHELGGATLGIIGLGAIGKLVAEFAQGLGMTVIAHDPFADEAYARDHGIRLGSLETVLAESDYLSLHTFLSPQTRHLIDAGALARMKTGAILINTARGGLVDEDALADALASGTLAGAALDTTETEPLPDDSRLRRFENVLITAHVGAATFESRTRSGLAAARAVVDVLAGRRPEHVINPDYLQLENQ